VILDCRHIAYQNFFRKRRLNNGCWVIRIYYWFLRTLITTQLLFFLLPTLTLASDQMYEQELIRSVEKSVLDGEAHWLKDNDREFLALFSATERKETQGAILVVHGVGGHLNKRGSVEPMRRGFPEWGWVSLSLQMPVRRPGAGIERYLSLIEESGGRIKAGIDWIVKKDIENIVLVGYGLGALMVIDYLASNEDSPVRAAVLVGLTAFDNLESVDSVFKKMVEIKLPLLDIYARRDTLSQSIGSQKRRQLMKKNVGFRQLQMQARDKEFIHSEGALNKRVYSWMMRESPGMEIKK